MFRIEMKKSSQKCLIIFTKSISKYLQNNNNTYSYISPVKGIPEVVSVSYDNQTMSENNISQIKDLKKLGSTCQFRLIN